MKRSEQNSASFDDAQVDKLLQDFFAQELPDEFRREAVRVASERASRGVQRDPRGAGSRAVPAMAALTLLFAAGALWFAVVRAPHVADVAFDADGALPAGFVPVSPDQLPSGDVVPFSLSENVKPVESVRYDTIHGVVEQRTKLKTTNVSFIEPESGELLELSLPELVIEVFPIDEEVPVRPSGSSVNNPAGGRPGATVPAAKLPEEG